MLTKYMIYNKKIHIYHPYQEKTIIYYLINKQNKKDDKVIVKLKKEYLSSEKREKQYKLVSIILTISLLGCIIFIAFCLSIGSSSILDNYNEDNSKVSDIKRIYKNGYLRRITGKRTSCTINR